MKTQLFARKNLQMDLLLNGDFLVLENNSTGYWLWSTGAGHTGFTWSQGKMTKNPGGTLPDVLQFASDLLVEGQDYTVEVWTETVSGSDSFGVGKNFHVFYGAGSSPSQNISGYYKYAFTMGASTGTFGLVVDNGADFVLTRIRLFQGATLSKIDNGSELDLYEDAAFPINYALADVKDISKKDTNYSKTVTLPGTKANCDFFDTAYELNGSYSFFDPNKRVEAVVLVDTVEVFHGWMQLMNVSKIEDNRIEFEVSLLGSLGNLYTALGDLQMNAALDFSEYDHAWTKENIENSWDTSIVKNGTDVPFYLGRGYVYPLEERGLNPSPNYKDIFRVEHFFPSIYVKEIVDKIFKLAGYTYKSDFFVSEYFRRLILPFAGDKMEMTDAQKAQREFLARLDADNLLVGSHNTTAGPHASMSDIYGFRDYYNGSSLNVGWFLPADNDGPTAPPNDPGGIFAPDATAYSPAVFQPNQPGEYKFTATATVGIAFYGEGLYTPFGVRTDTNDPPRVTLAIRDLNTGLDVASKAVPLTVNYATWKNNVYYVEYDMDVWYTAKSLGTGDLKLAAAVYFNMPSSTYVTNFPLNNAAGTEVGIVPYVRTGSTQSATCSAKLSEGDTISLSDWLPKIKVTDFLSSITKMFNLYIVEDKDDPRRLLIEPHDDYYASGGTQLDWTDKLDRSSTLTLTPMSELDWKRYIFSYATDTDFYNKDYTENKAVQKSKLSKTYGERTVTVDNDFLTEDNKLDIIFSPTPSALHDVGRGDLTEKVIPHYVNQGKNTKYTTMSPKTRILFYGGRIPLTNDGWWFQADFDPVPTTSYSDYPYAGHFDHPVNPTEDLNFALTDYYYWPINTKSVNSYWGSSSVTTSNLYNKFYRNLIEKITDKDSRLLTAYFHLNPRDINQFDFRDKIFVDDEYWIVNKIVDYDPMEGITKVELLKDNGYHIVRRERTGSATTEEVPRYSFETDGRSNFSTAGVDTVSVIGSNNNIADVGATSVIGDDNKVSSEASNVMILGNNNYVASGLTDVFVIGSGRRITESNVISIGNGITIKDGVVEFVIDIIDGGRDELQGSFGDSVIDRVDGGIDAVRGRRSDTPVNKVDGNI